jgi:hypothetical protein
VGKNSDSFLKYLKKIGLKLGEMIKVKEVEEYDGSMKIQLMETKAEVMLSKEATANLLVD